MSRPKVVIKDGMVHFLRPVQATFEDRPENWERFWREQGLGPEGEDGRDSDAQPSG